MADLQGLYAQYRTERAQLIEWMANNMDAPEVVRDAVTEAFKTKSRMCDALLTFIEMGVEQ